MTADVENAPARIIAPSSLGEHASRRRIENVRKAAEEWAAALVDMGGRNSLLRYRDLKQGTLDLTHACPRALDALLRGEPVAISSLFDDSNEHRQTLRRIGAIHHKAKENFEERGLETLAIACGLATWENKRSTWQPCAPVLLRQVTLRPLGAAHTDFELALDDDLEVNPILLHLLKIDFDCDIDHDEVVAHMARVVDERELDKAYQRLIGLAERVPAFRVETRVVLANFTYAKLPMVKDIETSVDELHRHDLIAAIAGDEEARDAIRSRGRDLDGTQASDHTPLADEFLVLDADASQSAVISSVLAGQSLIIKGPPGTGKSQTIANLIASLLARNKRALFVAEKRAAIDAVTKRLDEAGLDNLILDLHGGISSRRAFVQTIGQTLMCSSSAARADDDTALQHVEKRRTELNAHAVALHDKRPPWALSVYEIRARLLGLEHSRSESRFRGHTLEALGSAEARQIEEHLAEYVRLGGLTFTASDSPWARAPITTPDEALDASALVDELRRHLLPSVGAALRRAGEETGLPNAITIADWAPRVQLWDDLAARSSPTIPAAKGSALAIALQWRQLGGDGKPCAPQRTHELVASYKHLRALLDRLETRIGRSDLTRMPPAQLGELLDLLAVDQVTLSKLPTLHRLRGALLAGGLGQFLSELQTLERQPVLEEAAIDRFRYAWLHSIVDHLSLVDPRVGAFEPKNHERAVREFRRGDRAHIASGPARIQELCAEHATRTMSEFPEQLALVEHQLGLKRRHLPVRELVRNAPDVLLALKPCWAMSPLVVSELLPPEPCFDVVIFDEASQVTPADAVASLLRGKQVVVAGDEKQLPPAAFFVSDLLAEDEDENPHAAQEQPSLIGGTSGFESIIDAVGSLLTTQKLIWHYRSRDERLISFSNTHIYNRTLTTFPGVGGRQVLRHVPVAWDPDAETNSPTPEVDAVVDLILDHAREQPQESLGVIAFGIKHANRIEDCLRQRLSHDPILAAELSNFFNEDRAEPFFVKNLERVQGDERDSIILSIGYGKDARGNLPHRFGALLIEGGERRLNVAITRAKNCITLVSSFSSRDIDPGRTAAKGVRLLRQYLQFVESNGANPGDRPLETRALNPLEVDICETLTEAGLKLTPLHGSSSYRIDFAVSHQFHPDRYVLAIECDGASYHSSKSARDRDRLRQDHLERLGWRFHRIWSSQWFYNKDAVVDEVLANYKAACTTANEPKRVFPHPPMATQG